MDKKVLITQSNYIPWKGYFDNIATVDEFVIYDDMQYTKRDWRNRNKIKTSFGITWLTIPIKVKGKYFQKINETKISDKNWNIKHLNTLRQHYSKAEKFGEVFPFVENLYLNANQQFLTEINFHFLSNICGYMGIKTKFSFSSDFELLKEGKTERLVDLCLKLNATQYYTGPAAKDYMDESIFVASGISVVYFNYEGYSAYHQLHGSFEHYVSIIDLLFMEGKNSKKFLRKNNN